MAIKPDGVTRKRWDKASRRLLQGIYSSLLADGYVDPVGKTDEELHRELAKAAVQLVNQPVIPRISDHRQTLLRQARAFAKTGEEEMAILLYGTWFEHWINALLSKRTRHVGLTETETRLVMRGMQLEAKYRCVPTLLRMPRLSLKHVKHVMDITRVRNEFAHYKFRARNIDDGDKETKQLQVVMGRAEAAVDYFTRYERRNVFKGSKRRVKRLVE